MSEPELILHHYASSPYSEKVRLALGIKGVAWRSRENAIWPAAGLVDTVLS